MNRLFEFLAIDILTILWFAGLIFSLWLGIMCLCANPSKLYRERRTNGPKGLDQLIY